MVTSCNQSCTVYWFGMTGLITRQKSQSSMYYFIVFQMFCLCMFMSLPLPFSFKVRRIDALNFKTCRILPRGSEAHPPQLHEILWGKLWHENTPLSEFRRANIVLHTVHSRAYVFLYNMMHATRSLHTQCSHFHFAHTFCIQWGRRETSYLKGSGFVR